MKTLKPTQKVKPCLFLTYRLYDLEKTEKELLAYYLESNRKIRLIWIIVSGLESREKQKTLV
jgi:hypothetical protein